MAKPPLPDKTVTFIVFSKIDARADIFGYLMLSLPLQPFITNLIK
jgi:hypothetical protein